MKIDQIDLKIIRQIENGGMFFLDLIAQNLHINKDEVLSRLSWLESENLIKGYKATA